MLVPIGFIYVQLLDQPEPKNLWPTVQWADVSSGCAGLFFRVLGGGSTPFGETQNENALRLTEVDGLGYYPYNYTHHTIIAANDNWSVQVFSGSFTEGYSYAHRFKVSSGEVRPHNKAIRIWKLFK